MPSLQSKMKQLYEQSLEDIKVIESEIKSVSKDLKGARFSGDDEKAYHDIFGTSLSDSKGFPDGVIVYANDICEDLNTLTAELYEKKCKVIPLQKLSSKMPEPPAELKAIIEYLNDEIVNLQELIRKKANPIEGRGRPIDDMIIPFQDEEIRNFLRDYVNLEILNLNYSPETLK